MTYRSFATLAAAFAAFMIVSVPASVAAAKSEPASQSVAATQAKAKAPELYAQAGGFSNDDRLVRLDAQTMSTPAQTQPAKSSSEAPLNLMALVIAGFAVMGSLAFRRSPNK